jgi:KDO2-lipid IV(A) lauroyltransferase
MGVVAGEDETVSPDAVGGGGPVSPVPIDEEPRPTLQDRIEYILLRMTGAAASLLPRRAALLLARIIGVVGFDLLRIRRRTTINNLGRAWPEATPAWLKRTARAAYVNLGVVSVEMLRARSLDAAGVIALVRLDPGEEERLREIVEDRSGAVIVGGHYGTWELLGARLAALGYPSIAIMQDQRNPLMNRELNETRGRLGLEVVERRAAPRRVIRTLQEGGLVLIVGDQDAGAGGAFVDFFGRPASTTTGPAWFAARSGAAFLGAWIHREGGSYRMGFDELEEMEPVVSLPAGTDREALVGAMTAAYMRWLEDVIRADPGQYLWLHRRWKSRPDGDRP